jgi:hypothetical protein
MAREELARASSRNQVLDAFFSFACQFFEYSALFAVHNALAEGLNAAGPGADHESHPGARCAARLAELPVRSRREL